MDAHASPAASRRAARPEAISSSRASCSLTWLGLGLGLGSGLESGLGLGIGSDLVLLRRRHALVGRCEEGAAPRRLEHRRVRVRDRVRG